MASLLMPAAQHVPGEEQNSAPRVSLAGSRYDWASWRTAPLASGGVLLLVAAVFVEARTIPSGTIGSGVAAAGTQGR